MRSAGTVSRPGAARWFCRAVLCCVLAAPPAAASADQVDDFARSFIMRRAMPAAAVAVVRDGRIVKAAGYGTANLELGVPATEHTLFEIGSVTKQFTAEAVMMLVDEGKIGLADPIARYLPGLPPDWAPITVLQLLTHTSGLHDWETAGDLSYRREYAPNEYITVVASHPLDFTPGTRWSYTNSAFPLLGMIIEKVSGTPFETFVAERIFKPAGMTETRFKHSEEIVQGRAAGYVDRGGTLQNGEPLRPRVIAPNGGILSSATDMASWQIALADGKIVKTETLRRMTSPLHLSDGSEFSSAGTAWFIQTFRGHRMLLHNGSTIAGFSSVVYWYPDDRLMVVALANVDRWNAINVLATRVASFFVPGLAAGSLPDKPDTDPVMSKKLLALVSDVGAGRDSDLLAPALRNPPGAPRVPASFGFTGRVDRFAPVDIEDFGSAGIDRFGSRVTRVYRYRLTAGARIICYTFEVQADGKVSRMFPEEE